MDMQSLDENPAAKDVETSQNDSTVALLTLSETAILGANSDVDQTLA